MAAAVQIAGIRKVFGKGERAVEVLKRIDIDVAPGEFLILVGPSGCGKSTLLNIIAGLEEPSEGELRIAGRNVLGVAPAQRARWDYRRRMQLALGMLRDPALDAVVTGESPFDMLPEVMAGLAQTAGDVLCHRLRY